ncbi:MAG: hypothetical protein ACE5JJ_12205 [Nitrospinota bacterium]
MPCQSRNHQPDLKPSHFAALYREFNAPVARFDCGKKCSPYNEGTPFCCDSGWLVPVTYREEWVHLRGKTRLWHEFRARSRSEEKTVEELDDGSCLLECRGVAHCERANRSISCRMFPFNPFLTATGELLGLVYYYILERKCYLVDRPRVVTRRYVEESLRFWRRMFDLLPPERDYYRDQSRAYRQQMSRRKKPICVLTPEGPFEASCRGGALLGPWTYPDLPERAYRPGV